MNHNARHKASGKAHGRDEGPAYAIDAPRADDKLPARPPAHLRTNSRARKEDVDPSLRRDAQAPMAGVNAGRARKRVAATFAGVGTAIVLAAVVAPWARGLVERDAGKPIEGLREKAMASITQAEEEEPAKPQLDVDAITVLRASSDEVAEGRHSPVLIGDSVPGDAEWMGTFPDALVDAAISRRPDQALEICKGYAAQNVFGSVVVLAAFSNTTATPDELSEMIGAIGEDHAIFLVGTVNPDGFQDEANTNLVAAADEHDNVGYVDWPSVCAGHESEYLWADMTHLRPEGGVIYVDMVKRAVAQAMVDAGGSTG